MGWRHITLPDNAVYFYHPTLRVTTDIDLRTPSKLDAVTSYLQENSIDEAFLPPEGWESWLVDSNVGKKHSPKPISSWVNHAEKILTFASPSLPRSREVSTPKTLDDDRTLTPFSLAPLGVHSGTDLDLEYRYWAFMESHPAHASLPLSARSDALDALTWSYTGQFPFTPYLRPEFTQISPDCLLPSARPAPPPFSQDECQELIKLLETLGELISTDGIPTLTHTQVIQTSLSPRRWCTRVSCRAFLCV